VSLMSDADGALEAILDFHLVTKWKTAGDSLLGALRLARPDSRDVLIVGRRHRGALAPRRLRGRLPGARFTVWSRSRASAERLAQGPGVTVADDLEAAVRRADIVASATMATEPLIRATGCARDPSRPHRRLPPRHARGRRRGPRPRARLLRLAQDGRRDGASSCGPCASGAIGPTRSRRLLRARGDARGARRTRSRSSRTAAAPIST
jgi:ornithine cyclodeaminase